MNFPINRLSVRSGAFFLLVLASGVAHADIPGFNGGANWQTTNAGGPSASFGAQSLTVTTVNQEDNFNSAFYKTEQPTSHFTAQFTYTDAANSSDGGDGATFVLQTDPRGPAALGSAAGSGLGYGEFNPITNSVAVEFHIDSLFTPPIGTGLGTDGSYGTYATTGSVNLKSGDPIAVVLNYNGTTLSELLTDTLTNSTYSTSYSVNIPGLVGSQAYVGFTGGAGLDTSTQVFSNFAYVTPEPASWVLLAMGSVGLWAFARRSSR